MENGFLLSNIKLCLNLYFQFDYIACHFVMVALNLTYLNCLQHSFFEHFFNLYYKVQCVLLPKHGAVRRLSVSFISHRQPFLTQIHFPVTQENITTLIHIERKLLHEQIVSSEEILCNYFNK